MLNIVGSRILGADSGLAAWIPLLIMLACVGGGLDWDRVTDYLLEPLLGYAIQS